MKSWGGPNDTLAPPFLILGGAMAPWPPPIYATGSWHPIEGLSLKQLTLKTLALIAISSSDRAQTIHQANIKEYEVSDRKIVFNITARLKNTRRVLKPTIISCVSCSEESLDVKKYVQAYMDATKPLRGDNCDQLFISWITKKPVSKQTISRWLKLVLQEAGIDTSIFKGHSYRGAGLSKAYNKGASISQIVAAGNWSDQRMFEIYYNAPILQRNVENLILEE